GQHNQQLVPPEQHEFLPSLGQDLLHSGISDLRDSMSDMNTSSREKGTGCPATTRTPACASSALACCLWSSFSVTTCRRLPNKETREGPNFFFNAARARSGWSTSSSYSDPFMLAFTSLGEPWAMISPATMKPRRLHCSASSK